ncbi:restriction endonuclease subunit S [Desulfosporosinus metallidurans]|uniref:Type I restriction-modification system, specificity subunit S n=1 Tax=Desulfosporosinus metallidurans TaxID=1888891 RepID=A0A1Q8QZ07_9FIRM|nr:restriction endonuclease subunit S [Desulfosporosinus metallidurans]OLN32602.1 Type I restriction-modification system, specificity subunit S [Desulfosporosinus metallidurans]
MKYEYLGKIVDISKGKKHNPVEAPSLSSKRIIGINDLRNDITIVFTDDNKGVEAYEKDILIAWDGANAGTIGYGKKGYIGSTISRLRIKDTKKYSEVFLGKLLQSKFDYLRSTATGATIPHINRAALDSIKVPQFDLSDQIRIAAILTRAENLIAKRKESIMALDELLKSTFLEMFGDPVRNEKGFQISPLSDFIVHMTSGGRGWSKYYSTVGDRFIRSLDVQMNHISKENAVYVSPPKSKETDRTRVRSGDVLLTITGSCIGRVAYVPTDFSDAYVSQHVAIIRTRGINSTYLSFYLSMPNAGQRYVKKQQYGQTKPGLNFKQIESFPILKSPRILQDKFSTIVEKVESLKSKYNRSLTELDNIYSSLIQRAFRGELDLSSIPVDVVVEVEPVKKNVKYLPIEVITTKQFSEETLKTIIETKLGQPFDFSELMECLEEIFFEELPEYDEVKKILYSMLKGNKPFIKQIFIEAIDKNTGEKKKKVMLKVNV